MGVIQRFTDIMSANINALLDKAEDPAKMIDQYLRNLQEDLVKVKEETATVMAEEKRCERELKECNAEIAKLQSYAEKAVMAGNDNDAKQFLMKKSSLVEKQAGLQQAYEAAAANSSKMKQMYDKLCSDISTLNARKDAIKAKVAVAKTQEKINKIGSSMQGAAENLSAFDRMEAKANQMLDKANAMAELNGALGGSGSVDDLMNKYDAQPSVAVEDELAALKAKMGR